jgi:hypothetical protein
MIESIIYLVTGTPLDLAFTISCFEQLFSAPNKQSMVAVKYYLRYIKVIRQLTLLFPYGSEMFIARFRDADYSIYR